MHDGKQRVLHGRRSVAVLGRLYTHEAHHAHALLVKGIAQLHEALVNQADIHLVDLHLVDSTELPSVQYRRCAPYCTLS